MAFRSERWVGSSLSVGEVLVPVGITSSHGFSVCIPHSKLAWPHETQWMRPLVPYLFASLMSGSQGQEAQTSERGEAACSMACRNGFSSLSCFVIAQVHLQLDQKLKEPQGDVLATVSFTSVLYPGCGKQRPKADGVPLLRQAMEHHVKGEMRST